MCYCARYVAEENEQNFEETLDRKLGRRARVNDAVLLSVRNYLVSVLEPAWGEIGWSLQEIRETARTADVRRAFGVLVGREHPYYVLHALWRESESPATAAGLEAMRRQSDMLGHR